MLCQFLLRGPRSLATIHLLFFPSLVPQRAAPPPTKLSWYAVPPKPSTPCRPPHHAASCTPPLPCRHGPPPPALRPRHILGAAEAQFSYGHPVGLLQLLPRRPSSSATPAGTELTTIQVGRAHLVVFLASSSRNLNTSSPTKHRMGWLHCNSLLNQTLGKIRPGPLIAAINKPTQHRGFYQQ